jgi:purine-binding chemotaxis protein CheW
MNLSLGKTKTNRQQVNMVTFRLDHLTFALPIEPIRQIIEMVTITPVPQMDEALEGVINYHNLSVPVINMRRHIGMEVISAGLHTPLIIANISGRMVALMVDEVLDVIETPFDQITRPRDILPSGLRQTNLLKGIIQMPAEAILLLDLDHLFDPEETRTLVMAANSVKTAHARSQAATAKKASVAPAPAAPKPQPQPQPVDVPPAVPAPAIAPKTEAKPEPVNAPKAQPKPKPGKSKGK